MGHPRIVKASIIAVALAAAPAFGVTDGSCPSPDGGDAVSDLASAVGAMARLQNFASTDFVQRNQDTTFDLRDATDTRGQRGVVGTEPFSDAEMREVQALEAKLPSCVRNKANIVRAFRSKKGVPTEKLGIVGIAYAYNNGTYNKDPDGRAVRGGQVIVTDLFFDKQSFDKKGSSDAQLQVAMGWSTCNPANDLTPEQKLDVTTRARNLPAQLKKLSRERILFHEFIHGVTHEQEESGWTDPSSVEGFFKKDTGVARYEKLRAKLYQAGGQLEQYNTRLRNVRSRGEYCAIFAERSEYLKREGVPQRWPGDTHALDDRDEYVTILIEQMMYDPQGMTGYTAAEKQWAENWWNYTFNPAYKQNGTFGRLAFGACPAGDRVAGNGTIVPGSSPSPASMGYGATETVGGW